MVGLAMRENAKQKQAKAGSFSEPVFFFDCDFRTWSQVVQRARLNQAMTGHLAGMNQGA